MLLKRICVVLLCALIAFSCVFYLATFRLFDRPLTSAKQEEFREQIRLPDNFTLAASVNSFDTIKNTMQSVRKNVNSGAYAVELNITYDAQGVPYLADGPEYLTESSVKLETIFKSFRDLPYLRYVVRLQNHTDGYALVDLAVKYDLLGRILLFGFSLDDLQTYGDLYCNFKICIQPDTESVDLSDADACTELVQNYALYGASGVSCSLNEVTQSLCGALFSTGQMMLVLDEVNSDYDMYYALSLNPNIVITERPDILYNLMLEQDYLDLNKDDVF